MKLSAKSMEAAKRIAQRNGISVKEVVDAYLKASRRSSAVNRPALFLPR